MRSDADLSTRETLRPCVLVLAGGKGSRCGNRDKGWLEIEGEPLVVRRVRECSRGNWDVAISANRSLDRYRSLGLRVIVDRTPVYRGPLAAVSAALHSALAQPLITVPVDSVRLPNDVLLQLLAASQGGERPVFARDADGAQPLVALWPVSALAAVDAALQDNDLSVRSLQRLLGAKAVDFPQLRFGNINTLADLEAAAAPVEVAPC